ncbi:MAG: Rieske (2Fe-2S) protein [Opitutales bacterium]
MADWITLFPADDVAEGDRRIVTVGKREIGVFHEPEGWFACINVCPHAAAPICRGWVESCLTAEPFTDGSDRSGSARLRLDATRKVLRCPWHHWEFHLDDGSPVVPMKRKLKTYPVRVRDGQVEVQA